MILRKLAQLTEGGISGNLRVRHDFLEKFSKSETTGTRIALL
jgi:hypothetical protein